MVYQTGTVVVEPPTYPNANLVYLNVTFKEPFRPLDSSALNLPRVLAHSRTRTPCSSSGTCPRDKLPVLSTVIVGVFASQFIALVQCEYGCDSWFDATTKVVLDYMAYDVDMIENDKDNFSKLGTVAIGPEPSISPGALKVTVWFDGKFEDQSEPPGVFLMPRMSPEYYTSSVSHRHSPDGQGVPAGLELPFVVTIAAVTKDYVQFSILCTRREYSFPASYPLAEACTWDEPFFVDWRAWPASGYNETSGQMVSGGGFPYHSTSLIGPSPSSGYLDVKVSYEKSETLFASPPGMLAMAIVGTVDPSFPSERDMILSVTSAINSAATTQSFFLDITLPLYSYEPFLATWKWHSQVQVVWFAW